MKMTYEITRHTIKHDAFYPKRSLWRIFIDWITQRPHQPLHIVKLEITIDSKYNNIRVGNMILLDTSPEFEFIVTKRDNIFNLSLTCTRPLTTIEWHFFREKSPKYLIVIASGFQEGSNTQTP